MTIPKCFSCKADQPFGEVEYIASAPHKDGGGKIAFGAPLCHAHRPFAMVCGWFPIHDFNSPEGQKLWNENGFMNRPKPPASEGEG